MEKSISLTKNAIPYILSFQVNADSYKEPVSIKECLLKIETITIQRSATINLIMLSLSDGVNKSGNFYLMQQDLSFQVGNVIQISSIIIRQIQNNHVLFFLNQIDKIYSDVTIINDNENICVSNNNNNNNDKQNIPEQYDNRKYNTLSSLTTFTKSFCIYVKIVSKGTIKTFKNLTYEGKVFSFIMKDKDGYEMEGISFGNACEKVFNKITKGNFYEINKGYIRLSRRKGGPNFSDYIIQFQQDSEFKQMPEISPFGNLESSIVSIKEIKNLSEYAYVDVLGVVIDQSNVRSITLRNTHSIKNSKKLIIGDNSGEMIELMIWGSEANGNYEKNSILLFTKLKVREFRDMKTLYSTEDTEFICNPNVPQLETLKQFLKENVSFSQIEIKTLVPPTNELIKGTKSFLDQIHTRVDEIYNYENSFQSKIYPIVKFEAVIYSISKREKNYYYGCPDRNCKKKLSITNNHNVFYCSKCNIEIPDNSGMFYYTIGLWVRDCTMECKVELFGDTAERLLGIECKKYQEYVANNDEKSINKIHDNILYKRYLFVGKARKCVLLSDSKIYTRINVYHTVKIEDEIEIKLCKDIVTLCKQVLTTNNNINC